MIWTTVGKIMALAGLSLLMESSIASAQIYQWTDVKGVIHFTDNPYSIPESIRTPRLSSSAKTWIRIATLLR
jgi:uncharacterized protein DUF4124